MICNGKRSFFGSLRCVGISIKVHFIADIEAFAIHEWRVLWVHFVLEAMVLVFGNFKQRAAFCNRLLLIFVTSKKPVNFVWIALPGQIQMPRQKDSTDFMEIYILYFQLRRYSCIVCQSSHISKNIVDNRKFIGILFISFSFWAAFLGKKDSTEF